MNDLADDASHPIPYLDRIDVMRSKKGGGDLAIIVATPLHADERSQSRLLQKLENYVSYIQGDDFRAECGEPTIKNTSIVVAIHPESDPAMFEVLERCKPMVEEAGIGLVIQLTSSKGQ